MQLPEKRVIDIAFVSACFSATAVSQNDRREPAPLCRQHVRARVPEHRVQTGGRHQLVEGQRSTQGHQKICEYTFTVFCHNIYICYH
jgi:hypothetical protein